MVQVVAVPAEFLMLRRATTRSQCGCLLRCSATLLLLLLLTLQQAVMVSGLTVSPSSWLRFFGASPQADPQTLTSDSPPSRPMPPSSLLGSKDATVERFEGELVQELRRRSRTSSCWKDAVSELEARCSEALVDESTRSLLALRLAVCQLRSDGKQRLPSCALLTGDMSKMNDGDVGACVHQLPEPYYPIYIQFRLHLDTLCFHAQEEAFQERTEAAVTMLDRAATMSVARMKSLAKSSEDVLEVARSTQEAQRHVAAEARATGELVQQQFSNHIQQMDHVGTLVKDAVVRVDALRVNVSSMSAEQQRAMQHLGHDLKSIIALQRTAMAASEEVGSALTSLLQASSEQLERHRLLMVGVADRTAQLTEAAEVQQQRLLESHHTVMGVLDSILSVQSAVAGQSRLWSAALNFAGTSLMAMLMTASKRTSAARFLCVLTTSATLCLEVVFVDSMGLKDVALLRQVAVGCLLAACVRAAWHYESYEDVQRRVLREELTASLLRVMQWMDDGHQAEAASAWDVACGGTVAETWEVVVAPMEGHRHERSVHGGSGGYLVRRE